MEWTQTDANAGNNSQTLAALEDAPLWTLTEAPQWAADPVRLSERAGGAGFIRAAKTLFFVPVHEYWCGTARHISRLAILDWTDFLNCVSKQLRVQKGVEHAVGAEISRNAEDRMNKPDSSLPFLL
jgi:hypothetical protein